MFRDVTDRLLKDWVLYVRKDQRQADCCSHQILNSKKNRTHDSLENIEI